MDNEKDTVVSPRIVRTRNLEARLIPNLNVHGELDVAIAIRKYSSEQGQLAAYELLEMPELTIKLTTAVLEILESVEEKGLIDMQLYDLLAQMDRRQKAHHDLRLRIEVTRIDGVD